MRDIDFMLWQGSGLLSLVIYSSATLFVHHAKNNVAPGLCTCSLHLECSHLVQMAGSSSSLCLNVTFLTRPSLTVPLKVETTHPTHSSTFYVFSACLIISLSKTLISPNIICSLRVCVLSMPCTQIQTLKVQGFRSVLLISISWDLRWLLGLSEQLCIKDIL